MALPSPAPTPPPDPRIVAHRLRVRTATPTTCGWVSGNFASPVTCSQYYSCVSNTSQNVHACCPDLNECFPPTTCLDSTAVVTACGRTCLADLSTLKCTYSTNSYCYSLAWGDGMSQFGCATSPFAQQVLATYIAGSGSSGSGTVSLGASSQGGLSSPTSTAGSTAPASTGLSLTTPEIAGIAVGGLLLVMLLVVWPSKRYIERRRHAPGQPIEFSSPYMINPTRQTWHASPQLLTPRYYNTHEHPRPPSAVFSEADSGYITPSDSISVVGSNWHSREVHQDQVAANSGYITPSNPVSVVGSNWHPREVHQDQVAANSVYITPSDHISVVGSNWQSREVHHDQVEANAPPPYTPNATPYAPSTVYTARP